MENTYIQTDRQTQANKQITKSVFLILDGHDAGSYIHSSILQTACKVMGIHIHMHMKQSVLTPSFMTPIGTFV